MEEGSLLQLALDRTATSSAGGTYRSCLFLDLYSIREEDTGGSHSHRQGQDDHRVVVRHLLFLAELADQINGFFQSKEYLWHYGGDGPVFGVHVTDGIPHLRACCRYGPSVQDEWMAICYLREFTMRSASGEEGGEGKGHRFCGDDVAAAAWDAEDGQIILIQMADLLPEWLDEDSTDNHRHACWLYRGNVQHFGKAHLPLREAMQQLKRLRSECQGGGTAVDAMDPSASSHPRLQRALEYWLNLNVQESQLRQRTPLVLPRKVAKFLHDRPNLVHAAIQAFCEHLQEDESPSPPASSSLSSSPIGLPDLTKYTDWVWAVHTMSRTNYAMARTVVSSLGWTSPDAVPPNVGVEVRRYKRQCSMDATAHLKHAVALGVRVVVGLEYALAATTATYSSATARPLSSLLERMTYWTRIETECSSHLNGNNLGKSPNSSSASNTTTILQSFSQGPNNSDLDLTFVLKCPVYPEEDHNWTVLSHPQLSLREQILQGLKVASKEDNNDPGDEDRFWMPRSDQVDSEDWMELLQEGSSTESNGGGKGSVESVQDLNRMMSRFQAFMNQPSDVEGVATGSRSFHDHQAGRPDKTSSQAETSDEMEIRPHIFLNILHAALKGEELKFPRAEIADPFFYKDDYDLMNDDFVDGEDDDDIETTEGALGMKELMVRFFDRTVAYALLILIVSNSHSSRCLRCRWQSAMDVELEARTESRRLNSNMGATDDETDSEGEGGEISGALAEDAHVLNSLLQSLEASAGDSGPVLNMIREMDGGN